MARTEAKQYQFTISLGRQGGEVTSVTVLGGSMLVNHRGDLLIARSVNAGDYGDPKLNACFRSGSWIKEETV